MSKVQWERDLVERPFCQQPQSMGWQWLEGDTDVPEFTERDSFREVLLKGRPGRRAPQAPPARRSTLTG